MKINILLNSQSGSPQGENSLWELLDQSYVLNTHKALAPTVYTPAGRHYKTFNKAYLVGELKKRHMCKPQWQDANEWCDKSQVNRCAKAGGVVHSGVTPCFKTIHWFCIVLSMKVIQMPF